MALKLILPSLDGVPADVAKEYVLQDDGTFKLDVEGMEDTGALKRAKDHEKNKRKAAEDKATQLASKIEDLEEQVAALGKPGENKLDDQTRIKLEKQIVVLTGQLTAREGELLGEITRLTSSARAAAIVSQVSDHPELLMPVIQSRLKTVMVDGKAKVMVLDKDGDESFMSEEDLIKEIKSDKKYAPILRGSQGSGSGAPGAGGGGGNTKTKLSDYNGAERIELQKSNPAEFARLVAAQKSGK